MKHAKFIDAQEIGLLHPDTFQAPNIEALNAIEPGVNVKVCTGGERFWVIVTEVNGDEFTAEVNNVLGFTLNHGLSCGDTIKAEKRHVYDVLV